MREAASHWRKSKHETFIQKYSSDWTRQGKVCPKQIKHLEYIVEYNSEFEIPFYDDSQFSYIYFFLVGYGLHYVPTDEDVALKHLLFKLTTPTYFFEISNQLNWGNGYLLILKLIVFV